MNSKDAKDHQALVKPLLNTLLAGVMQLKCQDSAHSPQDIEHHLQERDQFTERLSKLVNDFSVKYLVKKQALHEFEALYD